MKRNNKKKGFTLVELLVVIAILAILASVTVVGYTGFTKKAKQSNAEVEAKQVETAILGYFLSEESASKTIVHGSGSLTYTFTVAENVITCDVTKTSTPTMPKLSVATTEICASMFELFSVSELNGKLSIGAEDKLMYTLDGISVQVGSYTLVVTNSTGGSWKTE